MAPPVPVSSAQSWRLLADAPRVGFASLLAQPAVFAHHSAASCVARKPVLRGVGGARASRLICALATRAWNRHEPFAFS